MSSLIPERQLVISPSLAATIGLEEAVLLQLLSDIGRLRQSTPHRGYQWLEVERGELLQLLPFWNESELQRVSKNLKDKGIILIDSPPLNSSTQLRFAMNETSKTTKVAPSPAAVSSPSRGAGLLAEHWAPDEDLLQLLALNHNIPRDFALGQREDFILYWRNRQQVSHSWPSKFRQHVLHQWRKEQSRQAVSNDAIADQWRPSPDALEILHRNGVSNDFIEDAIPEFVLYWRERGEVASTWNSKFIAHIRRQWARYSASLEPDYEPRAISANWQPSEDVYDILRLANIDVDFARQLVPEFVLFWRDTKEIQRSWNTKFLQHVKYQWATRHHMEQHYAGQSVTHRSAQAASNSPFQRLTDRSWAEGLVEDS